MTQGVEPNDIFHNGVWYNRAGGGGVVTSEVDPVTGGNRFLAGNAALQAGINGFVDMALARKGITSTPGTAPVRRFKPGTDFASGGSINRAARAVDVSKCGRESNSLKITPSENSNAYIVSTFAGAPQDWTGVTEFGFLIYSDQALPANATISFSYSNDQSWTNTKLCTLPLSSAGTRDGKQFIKFSVDQATSLFGPFAGSPLGTGWSTGGTGATLNNNIQWIRIDFGNLSGIPIWIEGIYTGGSTRPAAVLWFDNWWDKDPGAGYVKHSQYIKPLLDSYGWKCGITVPIDAIESGPTSLAEMYRMHGEGHDIILNDLSDPGFITSGRSDAQIAADIATTRNTLLGYGFTRGNDIWCLNQNESTVAHRAALAAAGVQFARAGVAERRFQHLEMGIENPLCVGSNGLDAMTSTNVKALFDRIVAYKAVGHCYWHKFNSGGTIDGARPGTALTSWTEEFADYMAHLRTLELAGTIDVLSPTQYLIRQKLNGNLYQAA